MSGEPVSNVQAQPASPSPMLRLRLEERRRLRIPAERLERYALRIQKAIASGQRLQLDDALVDIAEAHGIARRLYNVLLRLLQREL